ncbi:MAG: nucleoside deaminase [Silvibacterium sp.]|nr:nucleoside deaminase [Silvibacterium sp.]
MNAPLDAHGMLAVALDQARIGLAEGGIPVGGAIFRQDGTLLGAGRNRLVQNGDPSMHGETDAFRAAGRQPRYTDLILVTTLAPCWYCTGLIYQFRFKQVVVGESVNAQGGITFLRLKGFHIVDLASPECIELIGEFQRTHPKLWNECIGEG